MTAEASETGVATSTEIVMLRGGGAEVLEV